jgi:glycosyltransferase A (GT-A) superfamily protein (DUF2064 family)
VLALTVERARDRGLGIHLLPVWFDVDTEPNLRCLHADMTAAGDGPARTFAFVRELYRRGV